jgi:hypothetical protein
MVFHALPAGFPSANPDPGDGRVGAAAYQLAHQLIPPEQLVLYVPGGLALSTASGTIEVSGYHNRIVADLSTCTQMRIICAVGTNASSSSLLRADYATNGVTQTSWATAFATYTGMPLNTGTTGVLRDSGWQNIAAGAKAVDRFIRLVQVNSGTLTTAPNIRAVQYLFR